MIARDEAVELLRRENATPSLMRHALASEAVMRALAAKLGEDEEIWGLAGLLHDLDYPETESCPERHGIAGAERLASLLPDEALRAIRAHNGEMNGAVPETRFDFALRCGESVTGLVSAAALMRPTGYDGMSVKSVKKKMKDKAFAASVSRENIKQCELAGIALDDFLELTIKAMSGLPADIK